MAGAFFLAEFGDKTMLTTAVLATRYPPLSVWIGSTLGPVLSDGLAIVVGRTMIRHFRARMVRIGVAATFFVFGVFDTIDGFRKGLPTYAWIVISVVLIAFGVVSYRSSRGRT